MEGERFLLFWVIVPHHSPSSKKVRAEIQGKSLGSQEPMKRPQRAARCFALHGLLSLLSHRPQYYLPQGDSTHNEMVPPTSVIN